jgi:hypothetical protein
MFNEPVWTKIEPGHYVLSDDEGYSAVIRNAGYSSWHDGIHWSCEVLAPSGLTDWRGRRAGPTNSDYGNSGYHTMKDAKVGALEQMGKLRDRDVINRRMGVRLDRRETNTTAKQLQAILFTWSLNESHVGVKRVVDYPGDSVTRETDTSSSFAITDEQNGNRYKVTVELVKESA